MKRTPTLTAALGAVLGITLAGCGGGGGSGSQQAAGNHAAATELVTPALDAASTAAGTVSPVAAAYAGVYFGLVDSAARFLALWIHPDGRVDGHITVDQDGKNPDSVHFSGKWLAGKAQAKLDLLDAAGRPCGRIELGPGSRSAEREIDVTLLLGYGSATEKATIKPVSAPATWPQSQATKALAARLITSNYSVNAGRAKGVVKISRHDKSNERVALKGALKVGDDTLTLDTRLQPTDLPGLYRASTTVVVNDRTGKQIVHSAELKGHALILDGDAHGSVEERLLLDGAHGDQKLHFLGQILP